MNSLKVLKKDSSIEDFIPDKLVTSIIKAGVKEEEAEAISKRIQNWCIENSQNGLISSETIKDKVIEELMVVDPISAESYRVFKKN